MVPIFIRQKSSKLGTLNTVVIFLFHILFYGKNLSIQGFKKIVFFIFALLFMKNGTNSAVIKYSV
jgi:hypothetical protein